MFCVVPASTKANAVYNTVNEEINDMCPATILRRHDNSIMYCDVDSGAKLL
jgi:glucosamine-6-phosphate deaminase